MTEKPPASEAVDVPFEIETSPALGVLYKVAVRTDRLLEIAVSRIAPALALLLACFMALPASLVAQDPAPDSEDRWAVQPIVDMGMRVATRNLGTNGGDTPLTSALAVFSAVEVAPVIGAGVQLDHRYSTVGIRAMARTTLGGTYAGQPGACVLIQGAVCDSHESGVRVSSLAVEAVFGTRREADARVLLSMGAGLRHYDFTGLECAVDDSLCVMVHQIQVDQIQPLFTFGLTLEGEVEGVPVHVKVQDFVGSFRASQFPAEGELQNDLIITLGVGLPVR